VNKIRLAFRRWRARAFRDARATTFTVINIATYGSVVYAIAVLLALFLY
jgi:hypothetical protein